MRLALVRRGRPPLAGAAVALSSAPSDGTAPSPRPAPPDRLTREINEAKAATWIAREAETIPPVRRALHVIAGTVGTLTLAAWRGEQRLPASAYPWLRQPDPARTSQWVLSATVRDLIWHDRAVWRITAPGSYQRLDPTTVAPVPVTDPADVAEAWMINGVRVPADRLVVFDGGGLGGLRRFGAPLLDVYLRLMGAHARNADDPVPLTILRNVGSEELPPDDVTALLDAWEDARRTRTVAYAGRYLEPVTPGYSPRDLQLTEVMQAVTRDVARLFGLPGYWLDADVSSATYANVVDRRRDLLEALAPWTTTITQTLSMTDVRYVITSSGVSATRAGRYVAYGTEVRFDTTDFERAAFADRITTLATAVGAMGVDASGNPAPLMTVDEARALEPLIGTTTTPTPTDVSQGA